MKFINLFPEIKSDIQSVLQNDSNLRSSNVEIQQRATEYLALSRIATDDVLVSLFCNYSLYKLLLLKIKCNGN